MLKLIATSHSFDGEFYIIYGDDGQLLNVDFFNASLSAIQVEYLIRCVPTAYNEETFSQAFGKAKLEFVPADYDITFEMWWLKYKRKINKERALTQWNKLNAVDKVKAFFGITPYDAHLSKATWKTKADPENYLKNKYWNNKWD